MSVVTPPLTGTVLVTGASSGIGEALAERLAARAAHLVLVARRTDRLEALAQRLRARRQTLEITVISCELADPDAVDRLVGQLADTPIDVLVNNAGVGQLGLFERADPAALRAMIGVNVTGLTALTRALVPPMVRRRRGGVLNISSGFGLTWSPGAAAYAATKHYVTAFTEALRAELQGTGVVVTQVCPGPVATEFQDRAGGAALGDVPAFIELSAAQCADESLAGFEAGRALVVPGRLMRVMLFLAAFVPRPLQRWATSLMAKALRRRETPRA